MKTKTPQLHPIFDQIFSTIPATSKLGKAIKGQQNADKAIDKLLNVKLKKNL